MSITQQEEGLGTGLAKLKTLLQKVTPHGRQCLILQLVPLKLAHG